MGQIWEIMSAEPMAPVDAERYVDLFYQEMYRRAREKVGGGCFMSDLKKGILPLEAIQLFWRNWAGFVHEVNLLAAVAYYIHLPYFKRHQELEKGLAAKVADELIHPEPPGHMVIVKEQGRILGLSDEEMLLVTLLPGCRAILDFWRGVIFEGTIAERYALASMEEYIAEWAREFRRALQEKYDFREAQVGYFRTHEEADLVEHQGVMGHGQFNRLMLRTLLEEGYVETRPASPLEYYRDTAVDLLALFCDTVWQAAKNRG